MISNLQGQTHSLFLAAVQEKGCLGHRPHDNVPRTAFSTSAHAATFAVNSPSDVVYTSPGNGSARLFPENGICRLRAALWSPLRIWKLSRS